MEETDKIIIRITEFQNIEKILFLEKDNSQYVQQYSLEEHKEILEKECHLSIFEKENNLLIGYVILVGVSSLENVIEFRRIVISKKGFGYGKDSIKLIKKICFENYKANKIWLDVYSANKRAIKLYESQGFLKESQNNIKKDTNQRDLLIMSIHNNE